MQAYITGLKWYGKYIGRKVDRLSNALLILMGFQHLVESYQCHKYREMMRRMELLIRNINACENYTHLKACKAYYEINLHGPFPEYFADYKRPVTDALERKEQWLNALNN